MATCPNCGNSSRANPRSLVVEEVLVARPIGTFSLSGQMLKFSARKRLQLRCTACDWSVIGTIDGASFVADQQQPDDGAGPPGVTP